MPAKKTAQKKTKKGDITKETCEVSCNSKACSSGGCAYFLGFIGAAAYYISTATGFWMGVWGVIKAIFWPAFLVHHAFRFLIGM